MLLSEDTNLNGYVIRSYAPGKITINDSIYTQSIVLSANLIQPWEVSEFDQLTAEAIAIIAAHQPEVAIIGTGNSQRFPEHAVLRPLIEKNIGFEIMATAAACRTYNLLLAEGRKVTAGLIIK